MKGEYRDINIVERVNMPKFSKLDDIVTPLRLLELFFDDALATPSCAVIERKHTLVLQLLMKKFLSMLLLSGCHMLPDRKMYWEATPDTFV